MHSFCYEARAFRARMMHYEEFLMAKYDMFAHKDSHKILENGGLFKECCSARHQKSNHNRHAECARSFD